MPRLLVVLLFLSQVSHAEQWERLRSEAHPDSGKWAAVVCENGTGWRRCEMPLTVILTANPPAIAGNYAGSKESATTITAVVYDYFGNLVEDDVILDWHTSEGVLSPTVTQTSITGRAKSVLTAPFAVGTGKVRVTVRKEGGEGLLSVAFEDRWINANSPTYTAWVNDGGLYSCSAWSPATSTVKSGTTFTQNRTCSQKQTRKRQEREISKVTGLYRNLGSAITESRAVSIGESRQSIGTKVDKRCLRGNFDYTGPGNGVVTWSSDRKYRYSYQGRMIANTTAKSFSKDGQTFSVGKSYGTTAFPGTMFTFYEICVE